MEIWCSDKFGFLFWYSQIHSKVAQNSLLIHLKLIKLCNCLRFLLFVLLVSAFGRTDQSFLFIFFILLLKMYATSSGLISLKALKKKSVRNVPQVFIPDTCGPRHVMCFSLYTITSIHSIRKRRRNRQDGMWQNIQDSEDREIELIGEKVLGKRKKLFETKNWLMRHVKVILILFLKNMSR